MAKNKEKFIMPTYEQIIELAILFNDGKAEIDKISDMASMSKFILDRLYENGNILIPSSKEVND